MTDEPYELTEEWHMGKAFLYRLDQLLTKATSHKLNKEPRLWLETLSVIHDQIHAKMLPGDKGQDAADQLEQEAYDAEQADNMYTNKKRKAIRTYERFLMTFMEKKSLLTPQPSDPGQAFLTG